MSRAAEALREAAAAGVTAHLELLDTLKLAAKSEPPFALLQALQVCKSEIVEILRGERCRWCGDRLAWPRPVGVTFADGTSECMPCADREVGRLLAAAERVVNSPDALADEAEVMLRGEMS